MIGVYCLKVITFHLYTFLDPTVDHWCGAIEHICKFFALLRVAILLMPIRKFVCSISVKLRRVNFESSHLIDDKKPANQRTVGENEMNI